MNNFPCRNCLCIPKCRFKSYHDLVIQCFLIRKLIKNPFSISKERDEFLQLLSDELKPKGWSIVKSKAGGNISVLRDYYENPM